MIDLHLHTIYSDGLLTFDDIINLSNQMECISITDHNSVAFYLKHRNKLLESIRKSNKHFSFIIGTELTIEGYPDYLLYYPNDTNLTDNRLSAIEQLLKKIRSTEAEAIKMAYQLLGYNNWEMDFHIASMNNPIKLEARTRELAAICYNKRTNSKKSGYFEHQDLKKARIARRQIALQNEFCFTSPFEVANNTNGILVLAHPIRTAIKHSGRSNIFEDVVKELKYLLSGFHELGGKIIEWEFLDGEIDPSINRHPVLNGNFEQIRLVVNECVRKYNFKCIWGSDTHKIYIDYYKKWEQKISFEFKRQKLIPDCFKDSIW